MVIEKVRRMGNCGRLKSNGVPLVMTGMRGISTSSPFDFPFKIVAPMIFGNSFLTESLVQLHNRCELMMRKLIIGTPIMSENLCGGTPQRFNEFKNSVGSFTTSSGFMTLSIQIVFVLESRS